MTPAQWEGQEQLSRLGRRRHATLTQWGTEIALKRKLGSVHIKLVDENAYLRNGPGDLVKVSLRPSLLDDRSFALRDLRAILSHEIGHHAAGADDFDADAFGASLVGGPAMIRALRRYCKWCAAHGEPLDEASISARIARLRQLDG